MKKLLTMLVACGLLAGVSLTAGVGCGDNKATTKSTTTSTDKKGSSTEVKTGGTEEKKGGTEEKKGDEKPKEEPKKE